jgi:hypothetical protein
MSKVFIDNSFHWSDPKPLTPSKANQKNRHPKMAV